MSDELNFTPDEEQMRIAYWHHVYEHGVNLDRRDIDAEFTRGMARIKEAVRAEEREKAAQIAEQVKPGVDTDYEFQRGFHAAAVVAGFRIREQERSRDRE